LYQAVALYSYQAHLFGEVGATVANGAATLSHFRIFKITIINLDDLVNVSPLVIFSSCNDGLPQICPPALYDSATNINQLITGNDCAGTAPAHGYCYVFVDDEWGTSGSTNNAHDDSHARFALQWNQYTMPRNNAQIVGDASVRFRIVVDSIVKYTEGASQSVSYKIQSNSLDASPSQQANAQSAYSTYVTGVTGGVGTGSGNNNGDGSNESSSAPLGVAREIWIAGGVGSGFVGFVVAALVYFKVFRRQNAKSTSNATNNNNISSDATSSTLNILANSPSSSNGLSEGESVELQTIKAQYDQHEEITFN